MPRLPIIPEGSWPRRLNPTLAAEYVGEPSAEAFLAKVGSRYPRPRVDEPGRQLWLRDQLDHILLEQLRMADAAKLFDATLQEELATDQKLTRIAESKVNTRAA